MTATHSVILTSSESDPLRRYECPACGYVLETTDGGVAPLVVDRGDSAVGHPLPGQGHLVLR